MNSRRGIYWRKAVAQRRSSDCWTLGQESSNKLWTNKSILLSAIVTEFCLLILILSFSVYVEPSKKLETHFSKLSYCTCVSRSIMEKYLTSFFLFHVSASACRRWRSNCTNGNLLRIKRIIAMYVEPWIDRRIHVHTQFRLVWGSLRLAPIINHLSLNKCWA